MKKILIFFIFLQFSFSQNINVNNDFFYEKLIFDKISGNIKTDLTLNIRPVDNKKVLELNYFKNNILNKKNITIKFLGIDYFTEYNSRHPYNRNNGSMIPNRGYQHIVSTGFYLEFGPLSVQFKPEHHFSQNKSFNGFWDGHYPEIWAKRYRLWNRLDAPERFGTKRHNRKLLGQSSIRLNFKSLSLGISNENIWWGPSIRNSIMMSNHATGFKHITFNTIRPLKTFIGEFEWQVITGRLESSGYLPPNPDIEYAGTKVYVPRINQLSETDDWRYLQGVMISYKPEFLDSFYLGFIRWVQMYSALVEGRYTWLVGKPSYFPAFRNLFRKNDAYENYEAQTNQAAGVFFRWLWKESQAEIYAEFHHNDSKQNLRDLLLDSDHSRAVTVGIQKVFSSNIFDNIKFSWEWTQMEQTASRLVRNAGSWYEHGYVYDGYSNFGEVIGSAIGPGSNSHYFSLSKIGPDENYGLAFEIVDQDNDFFHEAFSSAGDYRRYWKDYNFQLFFNKSFDRIFLSTVLVYNRSLNYQWELDDSTLPYYHPGKDVNNFHINLKLNYIIK